MTSPEAVVASSAASRTEPEAGAPMVGVPGEPEAGSSAELAAEPSAARGPGRPGHDLATVIHVATRVFTERGYNGTSMDDVARALGVSKGAIYYHVSSKQEILERALYQALTALEAIVVAADADRSSSSAAMRLEQVVRDSVRVLERELDAVTLLLRVRGNTAVERAALERRRAIDTAFADLVAAAQETGSIRADLDPSLVSRLVFGTINSLTEWYRPRPSDRERDSGSGFDHGKHSGALADAVCAMIFDGLKPRR